MPIRPFGLARDFLHAGPGKAVAADADAVADRAPVTQDVIEVGVGGIDDQRSGRLLGSVGDFLLAQVWRQLRRTDFRLFFRRQRRQYHRPAVGPLRRLHGSGDAGRRSDGLGGTRAAIVIAGIDETRSRNAVIAAAAIRISRLRTGGTVGIDHRRRPIGTAVTGVVGRKDRALWRTTVGIDRSVGAAITRIVRRKDRALRTTAVGIRRRWA